ncbi:MAG TPA: hypothetical protein VFZ26_04115 [Gemmatimonadales bacterium]
MPSSISSSERPIPDRPWRAILAAVLLATATLTAGWELYWRGIGFIARDYTDTPGLWGMQRSRATGDRTILIGSSRMYFDINLQAWADATDGRRPIQLALVGTSPRGILTGLADDSTVSGLVVVGVTPAIFFRTRRGYLADFPERAKKETPSERLGQRLFMQMEELFAFIDWDTRLGAIVERQPLPLRQGMFLDRAVRKISVTEADRQTWLAPRILSDSAYRQLARDIWLDGDEDPKRPPPPGPDSVSAVLAEVTRDIARIRARGGNVAFVRFPSSGRVLAREQRDYPRARYWDRLAKEVDVVAIHYADYPALSAFDPPEWSHLSRADAERFTRALVPILLDSLERRR